MHSINKANFIILHWFKSDFRPRFTDLEAQLKHLYCGDELTNYQSFWIKPIGQINHNLIIEEWPKIKQIILTLANKETTQSKIIKKLCTYKQKRILMAIFEFDKLKRSIYIKINDQDCIEISHIEAAIELPKRQVTVSTFKIYNSLIGLETGVLDTEDVYTLFKWNGKQYPFPAWNHDQTLASATRDSVVWYFQELASRIGAKRMQENLDKIGYGNRDISGGLITFWLRSSLKISAREQVDLLYKLYSGKLPVLPENVEVVKRNITLSESNGIRLMGKTGSGFENGKWKLGWFVGCVEKQGKHYYFATNIQASDGATGGKAREIAKVILKDLGVL